MINRTDLDLDAVSLVKELSAKNAHDKNKKDEAVFYLRVSGKKAFVSYFGDEVTLVNSFISTMENHKGFYGILSSAVELFENESICVIEE